MRRAWMLATAAAAVQAQRDWPPDWASVIDCSDARLSNIGTEYRQLCYWDIAGKRGMLDDCLNVSVESCWANPRCRVAKGFDGGAWYGDELCTRTPLRSLCEADPLCNRQGGVGVLTGMLCSVQSHTQAGELIESCAPVDVNERCAQGQDQLACGADEQSLRKVMDGHPVELLPPSTLFGLFFCDKFPTGTCNSRLCHFRARTPMECAFLDCEWDEDYGTCAPKTGDGVCSVESSDGHRLGKLACDDLPQCGYNVKSGTCGACGAQTTAAACLAHTECDWINATECVVSKCEDGMPEQECNAKALCSWVASKNECEDLSDAVNVAEASLKNGDSKSMKAMLQMRCDGLGAKACRMQADACVWDGTACAWAPSCPARTRGAQLKVREEMFGMTEEEACGPGCFSFRYSTESVGTFTCSGYDPRQGCDASTQAACDATPHCAWEPYFVKDGGKGKVTLTGSKKCYPKISCISNDKKECDEMASCEWAANESTAKEGALFCKQKDPEDLTSCSQFRPAAGCVEGGAAGRCQGLNPVLYNHSLVHMQATLPDQPGLALSQLMNGIVLTQDKKDLALCLGCHLCAEGYHVNELTTSQCAGDALTFRGQVCVPTARAASINDGVTACDKGLAVCSDHQRCLSLDLAACALDATCVVAGGAEASKCHATAYSMSGAPTASPTVFGLLVLAAAAALYL